MSIDFSLIVPTLGRVEEVNSLLKSLLNKQSVSFEVILIDQNQHNLIANIVNEFSTKLNIKHVRVPFRGAARARNFGVPLAAGMYITFPDDDCEYFPESLAAVMKCFDENPEIGVVSGKTIDRSGQDSVARFRLTSGYLTLSCYECMAVEASMYFRRNIIERFQFDESLGVGVFHGAEEGLDLILQMLKQKINIFYDPNIRIYHPNKTLNHTTDIEISRVFSYRCGFAKVCLKHRLYYKLVKRIAQLTFYLIYLIIFDRAKIRYYTAELLGIFSGLAIR